MDIHNIHGTSVSFHDDARHSVDFLKNGLRSQDVHKYFTRAKDEGQSHFIDPHTGKKFMIEHDKTNDSFSVKQVHHNSSF